MSYDLLGGINSPDLCDSVLLEILHDDEPDFISQATILALLEWKNIKSRRFLRNPVGYDSNPVDKDYKAKIFHKNKEDSKLIPGNQNKERTKAGRRPTQCNIIEEGCALHASE